MSILMEDISRNKCYMFHVLYPCVTYLLTPSYSDSVIQQDATKKETSIFTHFAVSGFFDPPIPGVSKL
jgi:hypothetical protein